jgi:transcriptional enhancer factor
LFPPKTGPKNGFEDSLKNDPCLRALAEGRLPHRRYEQFDRSALNHSLSMKPVLFWLLITLNPDDNDYRGENEYFQDGIIAHKYTTLSTPRLRDNLGSIANWRQRFPILDQLYTMGDLNCDIIHMDVSLDLMRTHAPEGAELRTRTEVSIPSRDLERCHWQTVTSFIKPPELYRDPKEDTLVESRPFISDIVSVSNVETRIKVPFPATCWANIFTSLTDLQLKYEESRNHFGGDEVAGQPRSSREYTEQISMYQEVQSQVGQNQPFIRRAIILWTFRKTRSGETGTATWRYLDPLPSRSSCMSPSPHHNNHISASMNENFTSFLDNTMQLHPTNMLDPLAQGLATPPNTGGLQSPFGGGGYSFPSHQYDMQADELSFASGPALDSQSTLVDEASNLENFLSNSQVTLGDYDHNVAWWNLSHAESFDTDPAWADYHTLSSSTPQIGWDDTKAQSWPENKDNHTPWLDDARKQDWSNTSPTKQEQASFDQGMDAKLLPWTDQPDNEAKNGYPETTDTTLPELITGPIDT